MKVRVAFTLDVDNVRWAAAYGTGTDQAEVRADVQHYVENYVRSWFVEHGFTVGTVNEGE